MSIPVWPCPKLVAVASFSLLSRPRGPILESLGKFAVPNQMFKSKSIVHNNHLHEWNGVKKGTTQGTVSGPYLFNVFLNDLEIKLSSTHALFKYADDSTIVAPLWKGGSDTSSDLVEAFLTWANCNSMSCNPNKCKELVIKKKGNSTFYPVVRNITQHATLDLLGLTFQNDCMQIFCTHKS